MLLSVEVAVQFMIKDKKLFFGNRRKVAFLGGIKIFSNPRSLLLMEYV